MARVVVGESGEEGFPRKCLIIQGYDVSVAFGILSALLMGRFPGFGSAGHQAVRKLGVFKSPMTRVMKKSEKPSVAEVSGALRRAEDYATSSLGGILVGMQEDPLRPNRLFRSYTQLLHGLEVHYLFPNLKRSDRKVLSDFLDARNKLVVRRRAEEGNRRPVQEATLTRRFRNLKTRAKVLGRSSTLTPVQREVLEQLLLPNL